LLSGKSIFNSFKEVSGKNACVMVFLVLSFIFLSCGENNDPAENGNLKEDITSPEYITKQAKLVLGENVKFAYSGLFNADTLKDLAAGTEIENKDVWGIKFYLLKQSGSKFIKDFETGLLEGSYNNCLVQKIKFPSITNEMVYYNSRDYFLGSGGGEIFSYLVDFSSRKCYCAHLFSEPGQPVSLFLSANIKDTQVKNFFIGNFKRDYPALTLVSKDVDLKY
jgi:hypothetical protein